MPVVPRRRGTPAARGHLFRSGWPALAVAGLGGAGRLFEELSSRLATVAPITRSIGREVGKICEAWIMLMAVFLLSVRRVKGQYKFASNRADQICQGVAAELSIAQAGNWSEC